jgi:hypothetical protein
MGIESCAFGDERLAGLSLLGVASFFRVTCVTGAESVAL